MLCLCWNGICSAGAIRSAIGFCVLRVVRFLSARYVVKNRQHGNDGMTLFPVEFADTRKHRHFYVRSFPFKYAGRENDVLVIINVHKFFNARWHLS